MFKFELNYKHKLGGKMDEESVNQYAYKGRTYINDAKEIMLCEKKAHENEIAAELETLAKSYSALLEEYYQTSYGKSKKLAQEISELKKAQKIDVQKGVQKTLESRFFEEYITWLEIDSNKMRVAEQIERHVDELYRQEAAIENLRKSGAAQNLTTKISIPAGKNRKFTVEIDQATLCRLERAIWVEKPKFAIKNMSREKAGRFLSSATKRANEAGARLVGREMMLIEMSADFREATATSKKPEGIKERETFVKTKLQPFEAELESNLVSRINIYFKNAPETPFKRKLKSLLSEEQHRLQSKNPQNPCKLVCAKTIDFVLARIVSNDFQPSTCVSKDMGQEK